MVEIRYHTDPACPWSWALEPSVRRLKVVFGDSLRWTFVMGGLERDLLPRSGSGGLDPAVRVRLVEGWLRAAERTGAPVDPLIWSEGPLRSTYPASMAVKAAAEQAPDGGYRYLRRLREGIMCRRRKLDHAEALVEEARAAGLDVERFRIDLRSHAITEAFGTDLTETEALPAGPGAGAAGWSPGAGGAALPALVFGGDGDGGGDGVRRVVAGHLPFEAYRDAALACGAEPEAGEPPGPMELVSRFGPVTTAEVEAACELPGPRAAAALYRLAEQWQLRPVQCVTGVIWEAA
jgi:predicted DsbA family dithiol-disulfide isomerase